MAQSIQVTGIAKYVEFSAGHIIVNGLVLYVNAPFRINENQFVGAPGGDFGDYVVYLRPNRNIMESYYTKNWEYRIQGFAPGVVPVAVGTSYVINDPAVLATVKPDEMIIGLVQKRQDPTTLNTTLTGYKINRGKRLIDTKDISDGAITTPLIAALSVTAPKLASASVIPSKLDSTLAYTVSGLTSAPPAFSGPAFQGTGDLQFNDNTIGGNNPSRLIWSRSTDSVSIGDVYISETGSPTTGWTHQFVRAYRQGHQAQILLDAPADNQGLNAAVSTTVSGQYGTTTRKILDEVGNSDFLQLADRAQILQVIVDDAAGPWNGTNGTTNWVAPRTGKALLGYFVSAWATSIGDTNVDCYFNGILAGSCHMYHNNAGFHLFHSPRFFLRDVVKGTTYQIRVNAGSNCGSGTDDRFTCAAIVI